MLVGRYSKKKDSKSFPVKIVAGERNNAYNPYKYL